MNATSGQLEPVEVFRPWDGAEERNLRARILRCQRIATQRVKEDLPEQARALYWIALEIASTTAFAPAKPADLQDVIHALTRLFLTAGQIERWKGPDGH